MSNTRPGKRISHKEARVQERYTICIANDEYNKSYPINMPENQELKQILSDQGLNISSSKLHHGGFGVVCKCQNGSVVKISSFRRTSNEPICSAQSYVDIHNPPGERDENFKMQKGLLDAIFAGEAYAYHMLGDAKRNLVAPFLVAVYKDDVIFDYLICVNMPFYRPIRKRMKSFDEKEILKMVYDVLACLEAAHTNGIRHRDIKPDNIMYDENTERYILLDWGASCKVADNEFARAYYDINVAGAFSPYYIDPQRMVSDIKDDAAFKNSIKPETDLYALGVIMAFFAHDKGYFCENPIDDFHKIICPDAAVCGRKIIASDIHEKIVDFASAEYCEIVNKSMNHNIEGSYTLASEMKEAVRELVGEEAKRRRKYTPKSEKPDTFIMKPWHGCIVAAFLLLYTLILSGTEGFAAKFLAEGSVALSVVWLAWCGVLPFLVIGIINMGKKMSMPVSKRTVSMGVILFALMSLFSRYVLHDLNEPVTLDMICIQFLLAVIMSVAIVKIRRLNTFFKSLICGGIAGLCTGVMVAACICRGHMEDVLLPGCVRLIEASVALGLVCGLVVWYLWYLHYTKIEKTDV